jgi:hypothetical protein
LKKNCFLEENVVSVFFIKSYFWAKKNKLDTWNPINLT